MVMVIAAIAATVPAVAQHAAHADPEMRLLRVLLQLAAIVVAARVFAILFRKLKQPSVVGETLAGMILGPSVLRHAWPEAFDWFFRGKEAPAWLGQHLAVVVPGLEVADLSIPAIVKLVAQLGLVFLLFLIGLEFDFTHLKAKSRSAIGISVTGVVLPFALGFVLGHVMLPFVTGAGGTVAGDAEPAHAIPPLGFSLFMGVATSITAIPVLGRIMMELNITRTRLGAVTITAAAVDDASGWILLATVSTIVRSGLDPLRTVVMVVATALYAVFMIFVARPLLKRWADRAIIRGKGDLTLNGLATLFVFLFLSAIATGVIGIFAIFGAFILGAVLSDHAAFRQAVNRRLGNFVIVFFLPIFFTYTGLQTDVGTLGSATLWLFAGLVMLAACIGKFAGCTVAARLGGFSMREATCIGVMMNTRGLMELIVINAGRELGVIPDSVFCMLVFMAVGTTMATTPALLAVQKGTELEPYIRESEFARGAKPDLDREAVAAR